MLFETFPNCSEINALIHDLDLVFPDEWTAPDNSGAFLSLSGEYLNDFQRNDNLDYQRELCIRMSKRARSPKLELTLNLF